MLDLRTAGFVFAVLALVVPVAAQPRPEYPRPDFQRSAWMCLNGVWQFQIDNENTGEQRGLMSGKDLARQITVPFCPESALSGVKNTDFMTRVWYRRTFTVAPGLRSGRQFLRFGAVDWHAKVWLNGKLLGEHRGGYTPFAFEVTGALVRGPNELVVSAEDHTSSGMQATGKQAHSRNSEGCVYTRTTGIWQTVWLESTGTTYVRDFTVTPDVGGSRALVWAWIDGPQTGIRVRFRAFDGGRMVAEEVVPAAWRSTQAVLAIAHPKLWQPGTPFLYDLTITVERGGRVVDEVSSYFGLREITLDGYRFLINGKPVFQRLVLDQGFCPDGIYTAPTDAALRHDIELSMAAGFNGARLHQKVFDPRFLYWADRLGYIVWGEFPDWGVNHANADAEAQYVTEWKEAVLRDRNHPAIVGWCPLNETATSRDVARTQLLLDVTRALDPSRPFLDSSGGTHWNPETDVYDSHNYEQNPDAFRTLFTTFELTGTHPFSNVLADPRNDYRGQPYFVSEYGGTALAPNSEAGGWGYSSTKSADDLLARYKGLTDTLLDNPFIFGFCYTQLTDIEQEQNGVYRYDRTPKYDVARLRAINTRKAAYERDGPARPVRLVPIVPTSATTPQTWRYTTARPVEAWARPEFGASRWKEGPGGFGTDATPGAVVGTVWDTGDIWLRRDFDYDGSPYARVFLRIHHDEDAEVYVNGTLICSLPGFTTSYTVVDRTDAIRKALRNGNNVLAVHCHQTAGGQYIDVGLEGAR